VRRDYKKECEDLRERIASIDEKILEMKKQLSEAITNSDRLKEEYEHLLPSKNTYNLKYAVLAGKSLKIEMVDSEFIYGVYLDTGLRIKLPTKELGGSVRVEPPRLHSFRSIPTGEWKVLDVIEIGEDL
jgi:hypothetical protein